MCMMIGLYLKIPFPDLYFLGSIFHYCCWNLFCSVHGRIFALATVLSSVLIYNLPETVREADISRLSFAVEIAEEFYGRFVYLFPRAFLCNSIRSTKFFLNIFCLCGVMARRVKVMLSFLIMGLQNRTWTLFDKNASCLFRGKILLFSQQSFSGLSREISYVSCFYDSHY
jgi:hypothetical protein